MTFRLVFFERKYKKSGIALKKTAGFLLARDANRKN